MIVKLSEELALSILRELPQGVAKEQMKLVIAKAPAGPCRSCKNECVHRKNCSRLKYGNRANGDFQVVYMDTERGEWLSNLVG